MFARNKNFQETFPFFKNRDLKFFIMLLAYQHKKMHIQSTQLLKDFYFGNQSQHKYEFCQAMIDDNFVKSDHEMQISCI